MFRNKSDHRPTFNCDDGILSSANWTRLAGGILSHDTIIVRAWHLKVPDRAVASFERRMFHAGLRQLFFAILSMIALASLLVQSVEYPNLIKTFAWPGEGCLKYSPINFLPHETEIEFGSMPIFLITFFCLSEKLIPLLRSH